MPFLQCHLLPPPSDSVPEHVVQCNGLNTRTDATDCRFARQGRRWRGRSARSLGSCSSHELEKPTLFIDDWIGLGGGRNRPRAPAGNQGREIGAEVGAFPRIIGTSKEPEISITAIDRSSERARERRGRWLVGWADFSCLSLLFPRPPPPLSLSPPLPPSLFSLHPSVCLSAVTYFSTRELRERNGSGKIEIGNRRRTHSKRGRRVHCLTVSMML